MMDAETPARNATVNRVGSELHPVGDYRESRQRLFLNQALLLGLPQSFCRCFLWAGLALEFLYPIFQCLAATFARATKHAGALFGSMSLLGYSEASGNKLVFRLLTWYRDTSSRVCHQLIDKAASVGNPSQ